MVSYFNYCYFKFLLYEALVSEHNYGDIKQIEKTSLHCLDFGTENIEYIVCGSSLTSTVQSPWADFKCIIYCVVSHTLEEKIKMKTFYFPKIYPNSCIFLLVVTF